MSNVIIGIESVKEELANIEISELNMDDFSLNEEFSEKMESDDPNQKINNEGSPSLQSSPQIDEDMECSSLTVSNDAINETLLESPPPHEGGLEPIHPQPTPEASNPTAEIPSSDDKSPHPSLEAPHSIPLYPTPLHFTSLHSRVRGNSARGRYNKSNPRHCFI
jgi:hypothetical protein